MKRYLVTIDSDSTFARGLLLYPGSFDEFQLFAKLTKHCLGLSIFLFALGASIQKCCNDILVFVN
jgi:hypothetical protein